MKKRNKKTFYLAVCALLAFVFWTIAISCFDLQPIGPQKTTVGFAAINGFMHKLFGVNMSLYILTDWLSLIPIGFVVAFGLVGLIQWFKRKSILKVDYTILVLGGFYVIVMAAYLLFETVVINYRPILINGCLEVSYPSSTTMLVMCIMPTTIMQLNSRIKNQPIKRCVAVLLWTFTLFMIVGRLISGVHWFTDIIGGILLSSGLVLIYNFISRLKEK